MANRHVLLLWYLAAHVGANTPSKPKRRIDPGRSLPLPISFGADGRGGGSRGWRGRSGGHLTCPCSDLLRGAVLDVDSALVGFPVPLLRRIVSVDFALSSFASAGCLHSEAHRSAVIHPLDNSSIGEYSEELHRRRSLNWCYSKDYYKGLYALQTELDIKVECISTLKLILNRVWEEVGYCAEPLSFKCTSENCHITELSFIKECGDGDCGERIKISGESCSSIVECQRSAICRAIYSLSVSEGFKIVDPGYLDFRNMKRDSCGLRHVVPALCDVVAKIKSIAQHAFRSIDALGAEYYRQLNNSKFTKELRLSLADCICEFVYTIRSLDKELKKMEIYLSNSVVHGRSTVFL